MFRQIRERISGVAMSIIGAVIIFGCGLLFLVVLAPQQKIKARRVERLPLMDAAAVEKASPGEELLVTGRLLDNPPLVEGEVFVAYIREEWRVTLPDPADENASDEPEGEWVRVEAVIPDLRLDVGGEVVGILGTPDASLLGPVHETIRRAEGMTRAEYEGEMISEGSTRLRGFHDGDLVTALGSKASTGGILPEDLFAGDRVAYVENQHAAARGLMIAGISMMACSPLVLVIGILSSIFGRRRR